MIRWTIKRVMDAVDQTAATAFSTLAARKAMVDAVEGMIAGQPEDVKRRTRETIPALAAPAGDRYKQFAVYLGGLIGSTSMVLVEAVRTELYSGGAP
jgi:hypothetical protein